MGRFPAWQKDIMSRGDLYRVGGSVRDAIMRLPQSEEDVDYLVRGIEPHELERLLEKRGRIELVGKSFGVYKFKARSAQQAIDIAFPRKEVSTGPGHRDFDVDWDWSLPVEADLERRDFTINAVAEDVRDGRVIDPFGGRRDMESGVLRMVFPRAFKEDPLRILRGVRFAARFTLAIEAATQRAMQHSAALITTISAERIQEELNKTLTQCERPSRGFVRMHDLGVLQHFFPELDCSHGVTQNAYHPDDIFVHTLKTCDEAPQTNLTVRWAALLHDLGKVDKKQTVEGPDGERRVVFYGHEQEGEAIAERVLERLRFGTAFIQTCAALVRYHMFNYLPEWKRATVRRFIRTIGEDRLEDLFLLREADCRSRDLTDELEKLAELRRRVQEELAGAHALHVRDLAIDGNDLQTRFGIPAGPEIGSILNDLLEAVLDSPELNTRERLIEMVERIRPKK
jgi:poly(A) polymerase/tRNA nucleotidyltransferase (CCA-adding enzyme)